MHTLHLLQHACAARGAVVAFILGVTAAVSPGTTQAAHLLFYDPDARHEAIVAMTQALNAYFKKANSDLRFRPVLERGAFERESAAKEAVLAIVSSRLLAADKGRYWTPVFVPTQNGQEYYRKVLLSRSSVDDRSLHRKTVATTLASGSVRDGSRDFLATLKVRGFGTKSTRVLRVSQDIDALMALVSGTADVAVVTYRSIGVIRQMNAALADSLHQVDVVSKVLRPPLCVHRGVPKQSLEAHLKLLTDMPKTKDGRAALDALSMDGWIPFTGSMLSAKGGGS